MIMGLVVSWKVEPLLEVASSGCQAVKGEGPVHPGAAVPRTRAVAVFSQRAIAGKTTIAAGSAIAQNTIDSPSRTVSVKIDFIFLDILMSSGSIWIQYSTY
jgi:hypothetical protein